MNTRELLEDVRAYTFDILDSHTPIDGMTAGKIANEVEKTLEVYMQAAQYHNITGCCDWVRQ